MTEKKDTENKASISPTIIVALIGGFVTVFGGIFQYYNATELERQKFESELIFKALEPETAGDRAAFLKFLVDTELVTKLNAEKIRELADRPQSIPRTGPNLALKSSRDFLASSVSMPGGIATEDEAWQSWSADGKTFATSRAFGNGRVIAFGHDGILHVGANASKLNEAFDWLTQNVKGGVAFSSGHCEWMPNRKPTEFSALGQALHDWGYIGREIAEPLTPAQLSDLRLLVIGNAWGSFTAEEVDAVRNYVARGGGLMIVGLGWSWRQYRSSGEFVCEGHMHGQNHADMATYPMNVIAAPFGMRWLADPI